MSTNNNTRPQNIMVGDVELTLADCQQCLNTRIGGAVFTYIRDNDPMSDKELVDNIKYFGPKSLEKFRQMINSRTPAKKLADQVNPPTEHELRQEQQYKSDAQLQADAEDLAAKAVETMTTNNGVFQPGEQRMRAALKALGFNNPEVIKANGVSHKQLAAGAKVAEEAEYRTVGSHTLYLRVKSHPRVVRAIYNRAKELGRRVEISDNSTKLKFTFNVK